MHIATTPKVSEVMEAVQFRPAISIIMPFDPKMNQKEKLNRSLQLVTTKIEHELMDNYPDEIIILMMQKLRSILSSLNFMTYKKSIAIYVSPVFEKVLYLDIPVEERIIVDDSFEIRELVCSKKQSHNYLVLLLESKQYSMYLGNSNTLERIISNTTESVNGYVNETPDKIPGTLTKLKGDELVMNKYLRDVDNTLSIILNAYHLPLFITGTKKTVDYFKNFSKNKEVVAEYMCGNYDGITLERLRQVYKPLITDWEKVIQNYLLNQLKQSAVQKTLAIGISAVWREAMSHNGRLLVVEKDFMCVPKHETIDDMIYYAVQPYSGFSYTKDIVGDVIEKVLESGGDVDFVETGVLMDFQRIAMVQYY